MKTVLIETVIVRPELQCRSEVKQEVVEEYRDEILAGKKFPPVSVVIVDGEYILVDGFQRHAATLLANKPRIAIEAVKGTWDDAVKSACGANAVHGIRRTTADMVRALKLAEKTFPDANFKTIAGVLQVSLAWVYRYSEKARETTKPTAGAVPKRVKKGKGVSAVEGKVIVEPSGKDSSPAEEVTTTKVEQEQSSERDAVADFLSSADTEPVVGVRDVPAESFPEKIQVENACEACGSVVRVQTDAGLGCFVCGLVEGEEVASANVPKSDQRKRAQTAIGRFIREMENLGLTSVLSSELDSIINKIAKLK